MSSDQDVRKAFSSDIQKKGFRVWFPEDRRVYIARDVKFIEKIDLKLNDDCEDLVLQDLEEGDVIPPTSTIDVPIDPMIEDNRQEIQDSDQRAASEEEGSENEHFDQEEAASTRRGPDLRCEEGQAIDTLDRASSGPGGCHDGGGTVPPVAPQPPGLSPLPHEINTPKRQAVVDRLRRRIENYRKRQSDCMPRFGQAFNEHCEQNFQDTLQLKQRFLDAKAKRVPKTKDRKQESIQSSVHVQQKFLKRSAEENDPGASGDNFEPPVKLQCTTQQHGSHQNEGLTKFSVEIVQQLEFTTSAANSQPQQISTNVTVKAHTNASVKSDVSSPKSNPSTPASNLQQKSNIGLDVGTLVECVKQEPDNDFADLDQCAAALEKDAAANGGTGFGGFSDLIGEDTNDEIITSDAFNDLISDISNYPELMKDFDFEDKSDNNNASVNGLKVEDIKDLQQPVSDNPKSTHSPLVSSQNYSPPVFDGQGGIAKNRMPPYSNIDFCKTELSPAAQTLKQMAEQHQHKNQMGMSFNPGARAPNSRSPYPDFQFQGDYGGSPNSNPNFHKNSPNFSQPDMIKQEMIFQGSDFDMKRKGAGIYKQQYSPYSSPSASSHGSPGYLPRNSTGSTGGGGAFGSGTPPRPSSGPGGTNSGPTLQINQAQQLHITQQNHGHAIQVSAGQHLHLSGDLKGNGKLRGGSVENQHSVVYMQLLATGPVPPVI
ncbi:hypothetical protein Zmor_001784 [Zophobas morio]|uniref:Neurogenic mastermind-like N-terminal domain-containing protein n=1 Tax=Zophobas morio TaxID=2755281 RepID=A0AA38MPL4_9CUCU|nr:hypothetical protein Zmor_001784 [Zophobas morio]